MMTRTNRIDRAGAVHSKFQMQGCKAARGSKHGDQRRSTVRKVKGRGWLSLLRRSRSL